MAGFMIAGGGGGILKFGTRDRAGGGRPGTNTGLAPPTATGGGS